MTATTIQYYATVAVGAAIISSVWQQVPKSRVAARIYKFIAVQIGKSSRPGVRCENLRD